MKASWVLVFLGAWISATLPFSPTWADEWMPVASTKNGGIFFLDVASMASKNERLAYRVKMDPEFFRQKAREINHPKADSITSVIRHSEVNCQTGDVAVGIKTLVTDANGQILMPSLAQEQPMPAKQLDSDSINAIIAQQVCRVYPILYPTGTYDPNQLPQIK